MSRFITALLCFAVSYSVSSSKEPKKYRPRKGDENRLYKHVVAGCAGGVVARTVTAPIDRVKVLRQVTGNKIKNIIRTIFREGGIISFWKGNLVSIAKVGPESALKFTIYEEAKRMLSKTEHKATLTQSDRFIAAAATGICVQSLMYPIDTLKIRIIVGDNSQNFGNLCRTVKLIYSKHGLVGFYRGYFANIIGGIPYYGIELSTYETLKKMFTKHFGSEQPTLMSFSCALVSTCLAQACVYPTNLIRTRAQAKGQKETVVEAIETIYARHGIKGFYHGICPSLARGVPSIAINYMVYEAVRSHLGANMT